MPTSRGFTLIEILVTISIIALVYGVIINSFAGIRRSSRDSIREADLRGIQAALAQYYADAQFYPAPNSLVVGSAITSSTGNPTTPLPNPPKNYLSKMPTDPNTTPVYCYEPRLSAAGASCDNSILTQRCHYYYLCAKLENSSPNPSTNCSCGGNTYNYQITPL